MQTILTAKKNTGTEWFHQRVVNLVKEKAKAEMEQLEQELLKVIQAMEEATLSDNVALALSEVCGIICMLLHL
jgi:hypothetical protein